MLSDALSQEEIDALLQGGSKPSEEVGKGLSGEKKSALKGYMEVIAKSLAGIVSSLSGNEVVCPIPEVSEVSLETFTEIDPIPSYAVKADYEGDLSGPALFLFPKDMALTLGTALTKNTSATELGETEVSALSDVISQVLDSSLTKINPIYKAKISTLPSSGFPISDLTGDLSGHLEGADRLILFTYKLESSGKSMGSLYQVIEDKTCGELVSLYTKAQNVPKAVTPSTAKPKQAVSNHSPQIQPAQFQKFDEGLVSSHPNNLNLLLDIGLEVKVELGRTKLRIKDVLELGPGSVVELNKLAGEQVDLMVNDKLFAKGEVVVIDENFGVRITDILDLKERIESLGQG